jgi:hypothetical protein
MRRATRTTLIVMTLAGGFTVAAPCGARSRPVLYELRDEGDPLQEPIVSLFNPFRDRAPERPAVEVLSALQHGNYARAFADTRLPAEVVAGVVGLEKQRPLRGWSLRGRSALPAGASLFFQTDREGVAESRLWITVERAAGRWRVTHFEALYGPIQDQ